MNYLEILFIFGGLIAFISFLAYLLGHPAEPQGKIRDNTPAASLLKNIKGNLINIYGRYMKLFRILMLLIKKEGIFITIFLLCLLVWMSRYQYYTDDNLNFVWRINTITGSKCIIGSEVWSNRCKTGQENE